MLLEISFHSVTFLLAKVTDCFSYKDSVLKDNHYIENASNRLINNSAEVKRIEDQSEITATIDPLKETDNQSLSDLESIDVSETNVNLRY